MAEDADPRRVEGSGHAQEISDDQRKADAGLEQDSFWPHLGTFLQDGDVILAETGTSLFGILGQSARLQTALTDQMSSSRPT